MVCDIYGLFSIKDRQRHGFRVSSEVGLFGIDNDFYWPGLDGDFNLNIAGEVFGIGDGDCSGTIGVRSIFGGDGGFSGRAVVTNSGIRCRRNDKTSCIRTGEIEQVTGNVDGDAIVIHGIGVIDLEVLLVFVGFYSKRK